jgi:hypothetical protein
MRVNLRIDWPQAPSTGVITVQNATLVNGLICIGWGRYDLNTHRFSFTSVNEPCRMCFAIDVPDGASPVGMIRETEKPFEIDITSVLQAPDGTIQLKNPAVIIIAETDTWASL